VHSTGMELWKWTVDDEDEMQELIGLGLDGLITNFPDKALKVTQHNLGHRLGGDIFKPENTLYCFKLAMEKLVNERTFYYAELDVQETKDGKIVVFHDHTIKRLVPETKVNLAILKKNLETTLFESLRIQDLTLDQITQLVLKNDARIPTLKAVLDASVEWKFKKKMLVEIKTFQTDPCRQDLIDLVAQYQNKLNVHFLAFENNFKKAFPDALRWKAAFKKWDFKIYTATKPKTDEFDLIRDVGL